MHDASKICTSIKSGTISIPISATNEYKALKRYCQDKSDSSADDDDDDGDDDDDDDDGDDDDDDGRRNTKQIQSDQESI